MVAQPVGGVFLHHRVAQAYGPHLAVLVGEGRQHPHVVVAAGDHLLQDHLVRVAGVVDLPHDGRRFLRRVGGVDLLHAVEGEFPVIHAGGGLDDEGVAEAQRCGGKGPGFHGSGQHPGGRVGDAELVAYLVELGLFLDGAVEAGGGAGGDVLRQFGLAADDHGRVVVGAAEQVEPLAGVLGGKVAQHPQHGGLVVDVGHDGEPDDAGVLGGRHGVTAEGVTHHAVGFMKGAGKVVAVEVGPQKYGDQVGVHRENCISLRGVYRRRRHECYTKRLPLISLLVSAVSCSVGRGLDPAARTFLRPQIPVCGNHAPACWGGTAAAWANF